MSFLKSKLRSFHLYESISASAKPKSINIPLCLDKSNKKLSGFTSL